MYPGHPNAPRLVPPRVPGASPGGASLHERELGDAAVQLLGPHAAGETDVGGLDVSVKHLAVGVRSANSDSQAVPYP